MTLNEPRWTAFCDGMPPVEDIGKVFEIGYAPGRPYPWPFAVWRGASFTGIGATPADPSTHTLLDTSSLNAPCNYWRLAS